MRAAVLLVLINLATLFSMPTAAQSLTPFSAMETLDDGWEPLALPGIEQKTRYELIQDNGSQIIKASTDGGASGLISRQRIAVGESLILRWRWKVSNVYKKGDAREKSGDDYPARIYVAFAFEPDKAGFFERAKRATMETLVGEELPGNALNYIWANRLEPGQIVPNPFSDSTRMIAVNSGSQRVGEWVTIERDIVADYRRAFDEAPPPIIGIAIMSDADNTGESATAWYGDIILGP